MQVEVESRTVYGNTLIYPCNAAAHVLARIAGTKTLSKGNLADARALGLIIIERLTAKCIDAAGEVTA